MRELKGSLNGGSEGNTKGGSGGNTDWGKCKEH